LGKLIVNAFCKLQQKQETRDVEGNPCNAAVIFEP